MGNRITKVYTRTGDDGTTGMADGSRQSKASPVMLAIGDVDELNACIGVLRAESLPEDVDAVLLATQNNLFACGGELSMPEFQVIADAHVLAIEQEIDRLNESLQPLKEFILPAGSRTVALCHQARTVCRRAERSIVTLNQQESVRPALMQYINRLSDYLFVVARTLANQEGLSEVYWQQ